MANENYKGIDIKYTGNRVNLYLSGKKYKSIIDLMQRFDCSATEAVCILMSPCPSCGSENVTIKKLNCKNADNIKKHSNEDS